jgi:hypothetical protein
MDLFTVLIVGRRLTDYVLLSCTSYTALTQCDDMRALSLKAIIKLFQICMYEGTRLDVGRNSCDDAG